VKDTKYADNDGGFEVSVVLIPAGVIPPPEEVANPDDE